MFFNQLGNFRGPGGLDKNLSANSWVGDGKLLVAGFLRRLELREVEIRGKAKAKALTQRSQRKAQRAQCRTLRLQGICDGCHRTMCRAYITNGTVIGMVSSLRAGR